MVFLERSINDDVEAARFVAGQGFELVPNAADPMQPYKIDKDKGRLPVQFKKDRGAWRDFDSLLPDNDDLAPLTIQNALRLSGRKINLLPESVLVLGLRYEPPSANLSFWRMERFTLPKALAGECFIRSEIHLLLSDAKDAQGSLWAACSLFARDILSRGERPPIKKDISNFVVQMPVNAYYWATLESSFHEVLREFTLERNHDEIRCQWLRSVRQALSVAWGQHCTSVAAGDAWEIRAVVKAEKPVTRKLAELKDEILKLELEEKTE
jgi:CRISPR system Cascade subunit CasA